MSMLKHYLTSSRCLLSLKLSKHQTPHNSLHYEIQREYIYRRLICKKKKKRAEMSRLRGAIKGFPVNVRILLCSHSPSIVTG